MQLLFPFFPLKSELNKSINLVSVISLTVNVPGANKNPKPLFNNKPNRHHRSELHILLLSVVSRL